MSLISLKKDINQAVENVFEMQVQIRKNKIFVPLKNQWLIITPEEKLRQEYICRLINNYNFNLDQIDQEVKLNNSVKGQENTFADIVIWKSKVEKDTKKSPLIVVECKAQQVTIRKEDYYKGATFASQVDAKFFVATNQKQTRIFSKVYKIDKYDNSLNLQEILNIPKAGIINNEKEVNNLLNQTVDFARDDFSKILLKCHNIIRNNDKLSPEAAFDEISKILFIKTVYESKNENGQIYTLEDYLNEKERWDNTVRNIQIPYYKQIFNNIKEELKEDNLFENNETINIRENSFEAIIKELGSYNLSNTSDDIKGIAFERFLGRTFRGELGQFFTPRTIVNYMVEILDPKEGEIMCDPCCGSGGFLIKAFDFIRNKIETDIHNAKEEIIEKYYTNNFFELNLSEQTIIERTIDEQFDKLNAELDIDNSNGRLRNLSYKSIYGMDANPRMARTAKMNMIMHGDGHGGVHHHDGLINVNGVFEGRFDIIMTNPPFGARVEKNLRINLSDVPSKDLIERYTNLYGPDYIDNVINPLRNWAEYDNGGKQPKGKPILDLFETGDMTSLTEVLFIERCINLLKPGGRMGIVLPEGVLNNTVLQKVREFVEGKAKILNVTSIPQEVFIASGATIKPSLLFLQKFSKEEEELYLNLLSQFTDKNNKSISSLNDELKKEFKRKVDYKIFLVDIKDAGITTTGVYSIDNQFPLALQEINDYVNNIGKKSDYSLIRTALYSEFINWSVAHNFNNFSYTQSVYPNVSLKDFLKKNYNTIKVEDSKEYKRMTIRINNNGILLRDIRMGKTIGTKRQFVVKGGQFAISKIDARNGAMGLIPDQLDGAIVTPDFLTYNINALIISPEYLELITSTNSFVEFCKKFSSGTTNRQRLNEILFLNATIPLPPLDVQKEMAKEITRLKTLYHETELKLKEAKTEFEQAIFKL